MECTKKDRKNHFTLFSCMTTPCTTIQQSCCKYESNKQINYRLVYFSKGQYFWFEFVVQIFRASDYRFGGFLWEHEPNRFRMNLMFANNNLRIPDTSCSYWVDRWGGSNMMMPCSHARMQQNNVWCKHVSWAGNSTALIFIKIRQLLWLLLQICLQKSFVVCDTCKRNYALFDRLFTELLDKESLFQHWWKHWHMPSCTQTLRGVRHPHNYFFWVIQRFSYTFFFGCFNDFVHFF